MRRLLFAIAAAASGLAFSAPASAQWYPPPHGYAWGYHGNWGYVRVLHVRIDRLQRHINRLDARDVISEREARRLRAEARDLEWRLRFEARGGLTRREAYLVERRIARLEQRIWRDAHDGRGWAWFGW